MGNVDHDTQAVHFLDRKPAHFAKTAMPVNAIGFSGMGIRELVVAIMRKGHVATAHVKEFFNVGNFKEVYSYLNSLKILKIEYPILILCSVLGMMIMISSNDLIVFYMGLELQSLALYVLASFNRENLLSTESGLKYYIDSVVTPNLTLVEGAKYVFTYPTGHPFRLSTTQDGTHSSGSVYDTGVVNTSGQTTFTVPSGITQPLYYYCSSHSNMGGRINVFNSSSVIQEDVDNRAIAIGKYFIDNVIDNYA